MSQALLWIRQQEPRFVVPLESCRDFIKSSLPGVYEEISYGVPFYTYKNKRICYLTVIKGKAIIGLVLGAFIPDPFGVLEGNQKEVRHIDLLLHGKNHEVLKYFLMESIHVKKVYSS
jgi:hypothetical protein